MKNLIHHKVEAFLANRAYQRVLLAVSGGLDSMVLAHAVMHVLPSSELCIVHVNHGLSPNAAEWQAKVAQFAEHWGVPFYTADVNVPSDTHRPASLENVARKARYEAFAQMMQNGDLLLTAHHMSDQAETFFLRLCRGAGVRGLQAIKPCRPFAAGHIGRPLLSVTRAELEVYAHEQQLSWVEDESNQSLEFDRNYVRHEVLSVLAKRWPDVTQKTVSAAYWLQESQSLLDGYAAEELVQLNERQERLGRSLDLGLFSALSASKQRLVVRYWLAQCGQMMPSGAQLAQLQTFLGAAVDAQPELQLGSAVLRRFDGRLYVLPADVLAATKQPAIQSMITLELGDAADQAIDLGSSTLVFAAGEGGLDPRHNYTVCTRDQTLSSDKRLRSRPKGRHRSQTLKKLMLEQGIPPWLRSCVPVLLCEGKIAAVGDYWVDERYWRSAEAGGVAIHWSFKVSEQPSSD